MSNDVLLELGTEELPSGSVWPLANALADRLTAALTDARLSFGTVHRFATPRRLAVWIESVQEQQQGQNIVKRGPVCRSETPASDDPALMGFAKSCGVDVQDLTVLKTDKGSWWVCEIQENDVRTVDLLPQLIHQAVSGLPISKPMRWGDGPVEFARPVHWVVLLYGTEVVPAEILGVPTGRETRGHRFHHPQAVSVSEPSQYASELAKAFVIADFDARRQQISKGVQALAEAVHAQPVIPEELLDEVTSIVEWPQPLIASFDPGFLDVPSEALIAAMQSHQKSFALRDANGALVPRFITVSNIESRVPDQVIQGNENVMRARLSDAAFFYRQDKKHALKDYADLTDKVVFQAKTGTLKDKALRIQTLMESLVQPLQLNPDHARRAAELCKADLMTGMVGEFPELQGLMGFYYAQNDGEPLEVAQALNEQYMPRFAEDALPTSNLGLALSLADRLDTLTGFFLTGQRPTGVKDPFKLRRHALAVARILMQTPAPLNLSKLLQVSFHIYQTQIPNIQGKNPAENVPSPLPGEGQGEGGEDSHNPTIESLRLFILERLPSFYQKENITPDLILAARARQEDWLFDLNKRIHSLQKFIHLPEAAALTAASKRVSNLLNQNQARIEMPDPQKLKETAEKDLYQKVQTTEQQIAPYYQATDYTPVLQTLATLRTPVDAFFDQVMVMVEDPELKNNRLSLLKHLQTLLQGVADISLLQPVS